MEQSIQFMMGVSLSVLGLSFFFSAKSWMAWFKDLQQAGKEVFLPLGAINLLLGSMVLGFHQIWEGWPMIVSLIGALMILKGTVYLLIPGWMPKHITAFTKNSMRPYLMFYGLVMFMLGYGLLNYWYTATAQFEPTFFDMVFGGPAQ